MAPNNGAVGRSHDGSHNNPNHALEITSGQKMVSAMSGSLFTALLVTPLDVVRVRLQSQGTPTSPIDFSKLAIKTRQLTVAEASEVGVTACCREVFFPGNTAEYCLAVTRGAESIAASANAADCAVQEVQKRTYTSTLDGIRKIARNEGIPSLWRGLSPTLVMTVPANIIYFTGYEWLRYDSKSPLSKLPDYYAPLTSGSLARIFAATTVSPIELIRTRMQAASSTTGANHMMETFKGVKEMVAAHGYGSLWRGLTLTLWRDVPFSGLYWWGYETIRTRLLTAREDSRHGPLNTHGDLRRHPQNYENHTEAFVDSFISGALSGAFASFVTTPFDVGKTRTQVYNDAARTVNGAGKAVAEQQNMARLLLQIFQKEGVSGLWKGWIPRMLKVAPSCAIMISTYEVGKRAFHGVNQRAALKREDERV
ncbi:unnamed protein product [Clonostachys rosea]|uniref:Mitochondrial carrier protein n=1 Tax=Bionectria ochroleuca TaxID=29856 RepID=A0ABY6UX22_BIOOC|nr:unnamed protein product [Clonostachys rosea]